MTCSASKFGIGLNDFCQLRAPLHEWVAGQIAPVHPQHIEGVEDNSIPRMQASVLESLKRWASGLIDRHDLSVDDRLVGTYTPSSGGDGRVHAGQALLAPGPHRDRLCVPHQESPVPMLYPPRICYYRATRNAYWHKLSSLSRIFLKRGNNKHMRSCRSREAVWRMVPLQLFELMREGQTRPRAAEQ